MAVSRWMFTKEQILSTPSRKHGIDSDKELSYRQQAANLIQDMGQRLSVTQLCINTAIVYMHRFYMFQSFARFARNDLAPACLFLAAKVEEQPRKLEHVIRVAHACLHRDNTPAPDPNTESYLEQAQIIVVNENILLQTLGFETSVDHPHTHVVKTTSLIRASKDLAQTSYFLATNSLHLTTFCLQYRPSIVACVCIYLASKWSNWKIARSNEGKEWYYYVDRTATQDLLEELCTEFLNILDKGPNKLKKKIMGWKAGHREQLYQSEEEKQAALEQRKLKTEPPATSTDWARFPASSSQHRHTNHDRRHGHSEKKEQGERKEEIDRKEHAERREIHTGSDRKEIGPTGDGHPVLPVKREHTERRDIPERREERKDINDRKNTEIKGAFDRKDGEKKMIERKEMAERKDHEGKMNLHRREGEKKELLERKDHERHKTQTHERKDSHAFERKDLLDSKSQISVKKESSVVNTDLTSRTSLPSQNVKLENVKLENHQPKPEFHPPVQPSAKAEFVVPKLEKSEIPAHIKEAHSAAMSTSNVTPNVVPVSLNIPPTVDSVKPGLHKSKSEITLNYKEYIQRKDRERQLLLEKQGKLNLNKTFSEGSQSSINTLKQVNLDTSLPLKLQGALTKVKEEREMKNKYDTDEKILQESEVKRRTDAYPETKAHNEKEVKPRKRSNSKSPGASKRSPRVHNSNNNKISPIKVQTDPGAKTQGHLKTVKSENPQLKLQINNHSDNSLTTPPSPALKSPVKNLKEIPKSEPFVDLGEPLKLEDQLSEPELETQKTKIEPIKQESVNVTIPKITLKQSPKIPMISKTETKETSRHSPRVIYKQEQNTASPKVGVKQEPVEINNTNDLDIQLKPEHAGIQPLKLHIKELPDIARDIAGTKSAARETPTTKSESPIPSLKLSIKKEPGSGGNTPVKYKTEHSGGNTPLKLTIKQEPSESGSPHEPLKMKLKASHSGYQNEKHHRHHDPNRPEGHSHGKHKHKHKSRKHKDKDKDRERRHHSKHGVEVAGTSGKDDLKIRVKLSHSSMNNTGASSAEPGTYRLSKHEKHREGTNVLPEIGVINKSTSSDEHERHQPWSMSELLPKSAGKELKNSPSRKRRRAPTVEEVNDTSSAQPQQKAAKTNSHRLRRSSSSHSVVSMEMSDNECGEDAGHNRNSNEDQLNALKIKLEQAIQFQQKVIDNKLKQQHSVGYSGQKSVQPSYERQKSGFDLDLYCGNTTAAPPLPQANPPLPPTPPPSQTDSTPPPPPPPH